MMMSARTPKEQVVHATGLYHRGIICPAEAWYQMADAIGESDAEKFLNDLTSEEQNTVRAIHYERPESLRGIASSYAATQPVFAALLAWCERSACMDYSIEPAGQNDFGPCPCCGNASRCVWGFVHGPNEAVTAYYVQWTVGRVADHWPNFDLIIGRWGEGTVAADRCLVALRYRLLENGPAFMVIDPDGRSSATSGLVGRALPRSEVTGKPIASQAFAIADALLAQDGRLAEMLRW